MSKKEIFTVSTWNVNSIRSRFSQFQEIVKENKIDLILLQETKVQDGDFPLILFEELGYNVIYKGQKSYNGVAIASKYPMNVELKYLPLYDIEEIDEEARYIECSMNVNGKFFIIINVYVPMGDSSEDGILENKKRFKYKINFYKRLIKRLTILMDENKDKDEELNIIIGGDFNVAKDEIDLTYPEKNRGQVGFHPEERKLLKEIERIGFYDFFREKNQNLVAYTWYDYKTQAFKRNVGWRIDYLFGTGVVFEKIDKTEILTHCRGMEKPSDHTLVVSHIKI